LNIVEHGISIIKILAFAMCVISFHAVARGRRVPTPFMHTSLFGLVEGIRKSGLLTLWRRHAIPFEPGDIAYIKDTLLPGHSNGCALRPLVSMANPSISASITRSVAHSSRKKERCEAVPPAVSRLAVTAGWFECAALRRRHGIESQKSRGRQSVGKNGPAECLADAS
jgi:hypothetical protein